MIPPARATDKGELLRPLSRSASAAEGSDRASRREHRRRGSHAKSQRACILVKHLHHFCPLQIAGDKDHPPRAKTKIEASVGLGCPDARDWPALSLRLASFPLVSLPILYRCFSNDTKWLPLKERIFAYARVSTAEQAANGDSLATQRQQIEGYAMRWRCQRLGTARRAA